MAKRRKPFKTPFPLAWVEWIDSCEPHVNAEVEPHDVPTLQRMFQVGHLIKTTDDSISIAGCFKPECGTYDYVITIPKFAILDLKKLKI
jgi:hypothetical protein